MTAAPALDAIDWKVLQILQDEFPLERRPWQSIGRRLKIPEAEVKGRVERLFKEGVLRSITPVLETRKVGLFASTLIALRVPEERLMEVAAIISEYESVSHSYERNHEYNLWFTLALPDEESLEREIQEILKRARISPEDVLNLPVMQRFKLDVRYRFPSRNGNGGAP